MDMKRIVVGTMPGFIAEHEDKATAQKMAPSFFGVIKDAIKDSCEADYMASLRFQLYGTRMVVLAPLSKVREFMLKQKIGATAITPTRAALYLKMMDLPTLTAFAEGNNELFTVTLTGGSALYTPAGYVCVEQTTRERDTIGIAIRGFATQDKKCVGSLTELATFQKTNGQEKASASCEKLVAQLVKAGCPQPEASPPAPLIGQDVD